LPAAHVVHDVARAGANVPFLHSVGVEFDDAHDEPAGQAEHDAAPVPEKKPAAHVVHDEASAAANVPAAHWTGVEFDDAQAEPAGQAAHANEGSHALVA